jgi:hypothetical protein
MKKVYEYASLIAMNQGLSKFSREGLEVCVKIAGSKPSFFLVTDDEEGETEEEPGDSGEEAGEESPEEGDTEGEGEAEKKE